MLIYNWVNIIILGNVKGDKVVRYKGGGVKNNCKITKGNNITWERNTQGGRGNANFYIHTFKYNCRYLQGNKLKDIHYKENINYIRRKNNKDNKSEITNKGITLENGEMDNNVLTSYDRMVIGKYFKNFNKECKLMGNLEGWGYVQMPVEHIYADLYLLITTEGGQTVSLLYYNLYIII